MVGIALLVFRETLEAALLIGIIAAATRGVPGRNRWVAAGIGAGVLAALMVAALTGQISNLAGGMGTDLFNAGVLALAVAMLSWHTVWMASHGQQLAREASSLGQHIRSGAAAMSAACVAIAMAVLREGAETVLFLYGMLSGGDASPAAAWAGGALGLAAGATVGLVAYAGIVRVPMRRVFQVTSVLIMLLAASMAAQLARILSQADLVPQGPEAVWDTSAWVADGSVLGNVLHALTGYVARPSGVQLAFYVTVLVGLVLAQRWVTRRHQALPPRAPTAPPAPTASATAH